MAGMRGTLVLYAALTGGAGTERTGVSIGTTFSSSPLYRLMGSATNKWQFQIRNSDSSGTTNLYSATTPTTGKLYGVVATCAGVSGTMRMFVDGVLEASATAPAGTMSSLNRAGVGVLSRGAVEQLFVGDIVLAGIYSEEFSPELAIEVSANPWMAFRSVRRRFTVVPSGTTINATASITDADDTISAAATADVAVSASFTDAADATNSAGAISIDAAVSVTDATDATSATSTVSIAAALSVTDGADSITSAGTVGFTGITADAAITDTADSITAAGTVSIAASASIADATDATNAAAAVALSASFSVTDSTDSISATGTVGGSLSGLTAAEIAAAVWAEPLSGATTASQILSGMADLLRDRGYLP